MASRSRAPSGLRFGRERRADDQPELGVARRLPRDLISPVIRSTSEAVTRPRRWSVAVDDQHLVDADVRGEELVGGLDRVGRDVGLVSVISCERGVMTSATFLDR
jgi:hypothetical protein